jgi:two-component system phosphate regulon sensor histidine kinase PhoR
LLWASTAGWPHRSSKVRARSGCSRSSVARPTPFSNEEVELAGLLGRLVASAVQNIHAYETERKTVEELRRLSALRADFVSLVSHELRTPMAAVIGSARTLQERWRELSPDQRESFLELIAGETNRLAELISDVLDTSRIEAGTFSFRFRDRRPRAADPRRRRDRAAGQDEVLLRADVHDLLPEIRGDAERLRQVLTNLIDNAVKYSPAGARSKCTRTPRTVAVRIDVHDHGPGIAKETRS